LLRLASTARHAAPASYHRTLVWALLAGAALVLVPLARELTSGLRGALLSPWPEAGSAVLLLPDFVPLVGASAGGGSPSLLDGASAAIGGLWALSLAGGLLSMLRSSRRLARLCRDTMAAPDAVHERATAIAAELGMAPPAVVVSNDCDLPFGTGAFRPRVVLPRELIARASAEQIDFTLRHELIHVARGDLADALIVSVARRFFVGHPTAKRFVSEIALAREAAVDARVAGGTPLPYAQFLLELADRVRFGGPELPARLSMADTALTRRIDMLLSPQPPSDPSIPWPRRAWLPLTGLALGAALLAPVSCASAVDEPVSASAVDEPVSASNADYSYTFAPDPAEHTPPAGETPAAPDVGRLAPEVIRRTVREHYDAFRKCYLDLPPPLPTTEARLSFTIGESGSVTEGRVEANDAPALGACLEPTLLAMVFPKPTGGIVTVVYPVQFAPGSE
jgi:Zn-dependent protease with chaperone function